MIDQLTLWVESYQYLAPIVLFTALMLAGLNIPISEDVILLAGGALASRLSPGQASHLYLWLFLGAYLSAWEAYGLGRLFGRCIVQFRLFRSCRLERIHQFYQRRGFAALFFGRFIPFGFRNALFISAGIGGMPFRTFALQDLPGCLLSTGWLFLTAYWIGSHKGALSTFLHNYHLLLVGAAIIAGIVAWTRYRRANACGIPTSLP